MLLRATKNPPKWLQRENFQADMKRKNGISDLPVAEQFHAMGHVKGMTATAKRQVIALYQSGKEPRDIYTQQRQRQKYRQAYPCLRDMMLPTEGGEQQIHYMSLAALTDAKIDSCGLYRKSISDCVTADNRGRLTLICYIDECTAGNVLAANASRKAFLMYVAWLRMPRLHEATQWLTLTVLKSSDLQHVVGGLARAVRALLEAIVTEFQDGVAVNLEQGARLLFIRHILMLADADGLRACTGCKGAAANVPCLRCANVRSHAAASKSVGPCIPVSEPCSAKFCALRQSTLNSFFDAFKHVTTKKALADLEKDTGWNFHAGSHSFLQSSVLKPYMDISSVYFDSMHCYWSNGIVCQEIGLWWSRLQEKSTVKIKMLSDFVETAWESVELSKRMIMRLVNEKLLKPDSDYRGSATEAMQCLSLCVQFQEEILRALLPPLKPVRFPARFVCGAAALARLQVPCWISGPSR